MKILWLVLIFLVIGGFIIATSYNLNLKQPDDRRTFIGKFAIWLVNVGKNTAKTVGYVIALDWLPDTKDTLKEKNDSQLINYTQYIVKD